MRRVVFDLSIAAKQLRRIGTPHWSSRRIYLSPTRTRICNNHFSTTHNEHDDDCFRKTGYTDVVDLLSTPERNHLVRNDGQKVPVSSLKGKLLGLYLCENKASPPPSLWAIKKVYKEAKSRGLDFEIVQITFGKPPCAIPIGMHEFRHDVTWLILPPTDPSFKKIQRIFQCLDQKAGYWDGDSLVLIHPPQAQAQADDTSVPFEFSGTQILKRWGIEGYPFTRPSLYKAEHELQKRQVTLQYLFPPGESFLLRPRPEGGAGFDLFDAVSQLSGKKVLVLFARHSFGSLGANFVSMLKSAYLAQLEGNVAEGSKFEVVYVSVSPIGSSFDAFTKDMPWMVQPFPLEAYWKRLYKVFKPCPSGPAAAVAFNERGELIAKEDCLGGLGAMEERDNLQFPFIEDLEKRIKVEVEKMCDPRS